MTNAPGIELLPALSHPLPQIVFHSHMHNQERFKMAVQMANTLETAREEIILFVRSNTSFIASKYEVLLETFDSIMVL